MMQTFLPYPNFAASAGTLDDRRLNKQVVEAYQILTGRLPNRNHPACLMWQGYEQNLALYLMACCKEYTRRVFQKRGVQYATNLRTGDVQELSTSAPFWLDSDDNLSM